MTAGDVETKVYTPGPKAVDITPTKDGGVLKEIITEGEGTEVPGAGCTVTAHYHGMLTDGTVFDSSKNSNKPFKFTLGRESVIKAWEIGIATMKKGEVAMLTCKPEYAYGKNGSPPNIPPDATLIFEITLISWIEESLSPNSDRGILRTVLEKGSGYSNPSDGALVEVHLTGEYEGKVFEDRDVSFNLGEGSESGVIEGIEIALKSFKKDEKSILKIKPQYAFKDVGHKEFGIPPNAPLVTYTVHLKNFEKVKQTWDMDGPEKISQAQLLKEKASNYFKAGKYNLAAKLYKNAAEFVDLNSGFSDEEKVEAEALNLAIALNRALTYLKLGEFIEAREECDNALKIDPNNVKGLFRRGQAHLSMNEPEKAKADFEAVVKLEPTNKLAANQIIICCNKMKEHREREKKIYANMFEKFARKDKEDTSRFGWWDDQGKKPIIELTPTELEEEEEYEDVKKEKKMQLEHLRKVAEAKRKELEAQKLCAEEIVENSQAEEPKTSA